jgi:putative ABC transport system permease protein
MPQRDLALAFRTLRKSPVFALTAILTIALGVGASTAIFSVANAVLLRPLPYRNPDRLVIPMSDMRTRNVRDFPFSNEEFVDLRDGTRNEFADMAGVFTRRFVQTAEDGTPEQIRLAIATTNFFRLVGAKIVAGRDFTDSDGAPQPAPPPAADVTQAAAAPPPPQLPLMAILSYEYFQRRYGGNTAVIGQLNTKGPVPVLIVGVLGPGFQLYFPASAGTEPVPEMWVANRLDYDNKNRNAVSIHAVGRLKDGVSLRQGQAAVDNVAAEARKNYVIAATSGYAIRLEPMSRHLVAAVRPAILALMGAVIFLLLIACANVANLLLVRASLRQRELAVRAALGANWWDIAKQMLTEAFVLAAIGAAAGLGLAWLGIRELRAIAPENLPRLDIVRIDTTVLLFTALAGVFAAILFGMSSAWRASRPDLSGVLRGSSRNEGLSGGGWLRKLVVVAEVALSFVLLIGSGLMFRSFMELQRIDPGFDPRSVLTFKILGTGDEAKAEQRAAAMRALQERLQAIAGIQGVTAAFPFPLAGGFSPIRWGLEDALSNPNKFQAVDFQVVLPGYFEMMRTPLLAGRTFTEADNQPGRDVAVIDQVLADKAFPGQSAVGKRLLARARKPEPEWVEVIGVVAHQREESLVERGREQIFFADAYLDSGAVNQWAIRTTSDPTKFVGDVRAAVKAVNAHYAVDEAQPMETLVLQAQAGTRFSLLLIGVFAVAAGLLAAVGLYGVLATVVRQRTAEIGVRMALGAGSGKIFNLIVGHAMRLTTAGIGIGLVAALALTRAMTTMLVGVKATDPATFVSMAVIFFVIAGMAAWIPARRAAGVDPAVALRDE